MDSLVDSGWSRVEALLDEVLDLPAEARKAALDRARISDPDLAAEVADLLVAMEPSEEDLLEQPLAASFPDLLSAIDARGPNGLVDAGETRGRRLGAYRLLRILGRGGMGVVYLAERADREFEKQVAIKLMPRGMETAETERRFRRERQVLAALEHPSIARLLDGGVTDEGYPYLVMERVEGVPIDVDCRERHRGLRDRIELFLGACEAVQHAHQNMVIHRDLKPANILVTADGAIKLLDFGVAKLVEEEPDATSARTRFQPRTLSYASPEQIANLAVSTASDVYSLGVVLYRLLTGRPPHRLHELSTAEAEKAVREEEPKRPSLAVLEPPAADEEVLSIWSRRLAGDLDRIVLKALEKSPDRRYPTVEAFAEDLRRYRGGLPVMARDPTWTYRAGKLLSRHRLVAAAVLVVILAIGAALAGISWQARRAEREAARATAVAELLTSIFADVDPYEGAGRDATLVELLDRGRERVRAQVADPAIRADLYAALAKSYNGQGRFDDAVELYRAALAERRRLWGDDDPRLMEAYRLVGSALLAGGHADTAERYLDRALELAEQGPGRDSAEGSDVLFSLGALREERGDFAGAVAFYRQVVATRRRLANGPDFRVATALNSLSGALDREGHDKEGLVLLREAIEIADATVGPDHPWTASMRNDLGVRFREAGRLEEAAEEYRLALEVQTKRLGPDAAGTADAQTNLGRVLMDLGGFAAARPHVEKAVAINRAHLAPTSFNRIASEINLATLRLEAGDPAAAQSLYRSALERFESQLGPHHQATARARSLLARSLALAGDSAAAEEEFRRALADQRDPNADPISLPETLLGFGALLSDTGRAAEAEPLLREALEDRRSLGTVPWRLAEAELELGGCLLHLGRVAEAAALLDAAAGPLERALPAGNHRLERAARLHAELAAARIRRGAG